MPGIVIHRKITWLLLFSIFSLAAASWILFEAKSSIANANSTISQSYEKVESIQQMTIAVSGSAPEVSLDLNSLQELIGPDKDQSQHIAELLKLLHKTSPQQASLYTAPASNYTNIKNILNSMVQDERKLLAEQKRAGERVNQRAAYILILGRFLAFLFVVIILVQLNKDITRRKDAETGLMDNQMQLVKAIQEAQDAKQMQEQFLANMSHEIRTPMNGIKGMTDLLLGTPLSEKQHELAGIIKSSVNNLLVIVNDILDFSKIQAGKLNIEKIDFSVNDILNGATAIFEHRLKKKGLRLQVDIDPNIPARLNGDPHRLNQVLTNLLGNAIKFTDLGHIHIMVDLKERRSGEEVILLFTVTDTGVGIPEESLPYIFDSFSQAGSDISRRYGGTGLGLTICKQLVSLQGGEIHATSVAKKGSAFSFHLPYGYNDHPDPETPVAVVVQDYNNLLAGRRFLVAEDNEINQKLIDYVLRKAGGVVELFNNGAEAVKHLQKDRTFDLIIMDLQMPEMDGYAATRYIRKDLHMETPIIAMTATALKGEHLQCLESGMNEYMTKPFEFADLYKRINNLLS